MLEIVECDLEEPDQIGAALGNASVVICCIGAGLEETFDILGPYRIDYRATKNLIDAATVAKVRHFIMVSSVGTNKVGFPIALLNLFWGILFWKRKAEEALIASGLPYTIVRPGGMETPTDDFRKTHNISLSKEDTLFGGFVSNLQVAELVAVMAKNRGLSYCKVVEVVAETTAPLTPMEELLAKIPSQRTPPKEPDANEPDSAPLKNAVSEAPSAPVEKEPQMEKEPPLEEAKSARPLSPYAAYEDLKPPTSPTPTPSTTSRATDADTLPAPSYSTPSSTQTNLSEPSSIIANEEALETQVKKTRPLSPYFVYEDLKPPVSPMPTAPSSLKDNVNVVDPVPQPTSSNTETSTSGTTNIITETKSVSEELQITRPLSPYAAYEDLKPPTSPTPRASFPKDTPLTTSTPEDSMPPSTKQNDAAKSISTDPVENVPSQKSAYHLSPYYVYEDFKPPTSPSPSAPFAPRPSKPAVDSELQMSSGNSTAQPPPPVDEPSNDKHRGEEAKPKPPSPFTMYEDMKPPTSPMPFPRKL